MILAAAVMLTMAGCGGGYDTYRLYPNEFLLGESISDSGEVIARSSTGDEYPQLSEEDIQKMNGGKARFVYGDEGYVTFLQGRFSEDKIEDYEQAVAALQSVSGYFAITESAYNRELTNWNTKITKANKEIDRYKSRLEKKFSSMDLTISQMQQQYSTFLS